METLRDYLAAKAMQSIILAAPTMDPELVACDAYSFADAMIAVRERKTEEVSDAVS